MATRGKSNSGQALFFGGISQIPFDTQTIAASQAITTVQARLPLGQNCKVMKVEVTSSAISGSVAVQYVMGTVSASGNGTLDTIAVNGTALTGLVSLGPPNIPISIPVVIPDVVYPQGALITMRGRSAANNSATNVKSVLVVKTLDAAAQVGPAFTGNLSSTPTPTF